MVVIRVSIFIGIWLNAFWMFAVEVLLLIHVNRLLNLLYCRLLDFLLNYYFLFTLLDCEEANPPAVLVNVVLLFSCLGDRH